MNFRMVTLQRARNGDWFSRKAIPTDIREAYKAAHGVAVEERFRQPASMPLPQAKQELRDWDAMVSARIHALRAARTGQGRQLTKREAHRLAGDWYIWFVDENEDEPGSPEGWDLQYERLEAAYDRFAPPNPESSDDDESWADHPNVRQFVRARVSELGQVPTFLAEQAIALTPEAHDLLLDIVEDEYVAAIALLRRRAGGDYSLDTRPQRFPVSTTSAKASGLTSWKLFEAWVKERRPTAATINRWRSVFLALESAFPERDIASLTAEDAIKWKDTLVTEDRSPGVVNDIWLSAARTVFTWAKDNRMVLANPFEGVSVAVPRRVQELREREFTDAEWASILKASLEEQPPRMTKHHAAARRWVPWLCAYTGSRPGEITQLRAEDIRKHPAGFWTMHITPEAGTVKGGKARVVPLHAHLIEQGFADFVQGFGKGPLFYDADAKARSKSDDPTKPTRPRWVSVRQKLAEWVRSLGVTDPNISPNHAWRHTFKRRAARAGIERTVRDAICGHRPRDVADQYEQPTIEDMASELKKFPQYRMDQI